MNRFQRPVVVTIAAVMMGLMALLHLASAITSLAAIGEATRVFRDLARRERFDSTDIDAGITALRGGLICTSAVMVLFALLLAGLAYGIWQGNRRARVVTWVVCGLGVLCACCTGFGATASFSPAATIAADRSELLGGLVVRALPDWAGAIVLGSSGLSLLGYIATAVLLAFQGGTDSGSQPPTHPHPHSHAQTHLPYPQPPAHPSHPAPPPSEP
ncbi:hypothetical protein [Allorhizocola rhizosphaerae]|uniref:hypothetical protein n=1 Tax=Allorhizocola rhizosphaerae TaxID=1872709 RepID=UPI000E3E7216|nr:hypothetical protein [Allorhizocola rhizosphaerae]